MLLFQMSTYEMRPMACKRHRLGKSGHSYSPKDYEAYKNLMRYMIVNRKPVITEEPLCAVIGFRFNAPRGWSYKKSLAVYNEKQLIAGKRDIDNLVKTVLDACQGFVYHNDAQVVGLISWKQYGVSEGTDVYFLKPAYMVNHRDLVLKEMKEFDE